LFWTLDADGARTGLDVAVQEDAAAVRVDDAAVDVDAGGVRRGAAARDADGDAAVGEQLAAAVDGHGAVRADRQVVGRRRPGCG